jgi:DNA ligase-1
MRTQPQQIIQKLQADNSRLAKEAIILEAMQEGLDEFFEGIKMALDPLHTFGVKQVPERDDSPGQGCDWTVFKDLADKLAQRELTGHAARDAIELVMQTATQEQWNDYYRRILIKDLRCGVSEKTVNSVAKKNKFEQYKVPVFSCMLAHDSANHEKKMIGMKMLDYKLDGVRVLAIYNKDNNTVTMYSRNGKQFLNFGHVEKEIIDKLSSKFTQSMVLDGEMVSSSFQALMKQVHRKDNVEATDAKYALFDILTLDEFQKGKSILGCRDRHNALVELITDTDHMFVVDKVECNLDTQEGQKIFSDYNKIAIEKGFEGIMIKDVDAPYECKRSHFMLKAKPFIEVSLEIKDTEEGTGRNAGKLGALICEGKDDDKFIRVNVGSGLTDDNRDTFWADRESLVGQIVEIRADAITQNQDTENEWSLRFPRFMRFRGFEVGEKI